MTLKRNGNSYRFSFYLIGLLLLLAGSFYLHLRTGFTDFTDGQLLRILTGGGTAGENLTVFDFRMVRSVLAVLIGCGLSLSGAVFQTVSRNELASPGLLGVNAGAGLAVMLLVYFQNENTALALWETPLAAIIGAATAALFIYRLSYRTGYTLSTHTLVLTGISLTAGIHALQMLLVVRLNPTQFHTVNTWIIGSISGNTWLHAALLCPVVLLLGLFLGARYVDLNVLSLADETAIGLGLRLNRARFLYLMIAVILAACCVSIGGNIGFVGLICPHIARRLVGTNHARYLSVTLLLGAILVLLADWIGRVIIAPDEMLLGIVVSIVGAPYFLYILARTKA